MKPLFDFRLNAPALTLIVAAACLIFIALSGQSYAQTAQASPYGPSGIVYQNPGLNTSPTAQISAPQIAAPQISAPQFDPRLTAGSNLPIPSGAPPAIVGATGSGFQSTPSSQVGFPVAQAPQPYQGAIVGQPYIYNPYAHAIPYQATLRSVPAQYAQPAYPAPYTLSAPQMTSSPQRMMAPQVGGSSIVSMESRPSRASTPSRITSVK